jgi:hypothetical protein
VSPVRALLRESQPLSPLHLHCQSFLKYLARRQGAAHVSPRGHGMTQAAKSEDD